MCVYILYQVTNMTEERIHIIIAKYLTKESSAEEDADLLAWLSQNEENRKMIRSLKDAYDLGQFEYLIKRSDTAKQWKKLLRRIRSVAQQNRTISPFRKMLRYAAIFALGLLCMKASDIILVKKQPVAVYGSVTQVETGKGERSKVVLPDSTVVWLNACSSIGYHQDFGVKTRKIDLKGEAFFDVRKDVSKPFLVCADQMTWRVTGTSFNVYSFDNDNIAGFVLVEGSVVFEYGDDRTEIKPGELIEFDKTTHQINRRKTNTDIHTGWRKGDMMFEEMSFGELAKRLERNFNVTFVFENEKVKKESFGGTFRHYDSLETILKVISISTPMKYSIDKDVIYIR